MTKSKKLLDAKAKHTKALKRWAESKKKHLAHPRNKKAKDAFDKASKYYQEAEDSYNKILRKMPRPKSKPSENTPENPDARPQLSEKKKNTYTRCDSILASLSEKSEWTKKDLVRRADDLYREHGGNSNLHISQVAMQYAVGYLVPVGKLGVVKSKVFVKQLKGEA